MELGNILVFISSLGHSLIEGFSSIPEILSYGFTFDGVDYTVWGIMFTVGGITLYVSWTVIKWFIGW